MESQLNHKNTLILIVVLIGVLAVTVFLSRSGSKPPVSQTQTPVANQTLPDKVKNLTDTFDKMQIRAQVLKQQADLFSNLIK